MAIQTMLSRRSWRTGTTVLLVAVLIATLSFGAAGINNHAWAQSSHPSSDEPLLPGAIVLGHATYPLGPGTSYCLYHLDIGGVWQRIHVVSTDPAQPDLQLQLSLPGGNLQGRATVTTHAVDAVSPGSDVLAVINGDFFLTESGFAGVPTGLAIHGGQLLHHPWGPAAGTFANGQVVIGMPQWQGTVRVYDGTRLLIETRLDGFNSPRPQDGLVLYTPAFGDHTGTGQLGVEVLLAGPGRYPVDGGFRAEVLTSQTIGGSQMYPDTSVLSGSGSAAALLALHALPGREIEITWQVAGQWSQAIEAIGGRPVLLRNSVLLPDGLADAPSPHQPAPRSAIATSADGRTLLVAVDGRQPGSSLGLTLPDLALLLRNLGAVEALNLDGGGSTALALRLPGTHQTSLANTPSDGWQRAVGNALVLRSWAPHGPPAQLFIKPLVYPVLSGANVPLYFVALDQYSNPADLAGETAVVWQVDSALGHVSDNVFFAGDSGNGTLSVSWAGISGTTAVTVVSPADIARVVVDPPLLRLQPSDSVALTVSLFDAVGRPVHAGPGQWSWEVPEQAGQVVLEPTGGERFLAAADHVRGTLTLSLGGQQIAVPVVVGDPPPFSDISGHWSDTHIRYAAQRAIVDGYPDGTFRPDAHVTRGEFVKLLMTFLAVPLDPVPPSNQPYTDQDDIAGWLEPFLREASTRGWVTGFDDGAFRPSQPIVREAAATVLIRAFEEPGSAGLVADVAFADAGTISDWARTAVAAAAAAELFRGFDDNTFRPLAPLTRAEAVTILVRARER